MVEEKEKEEDCCQTPKASTPVFAEHVKKLIHGKVSANASACSCVTCGANAACRVEAMRSALGVVWSKGANGESVPCVLFHHTAWGVLCSLLACLLVCGEYFRWLTMMVMLLLLSVVVVAWMMWMVVCMMVCMMVCKEKGCVCRDDTATSAGSQSALLPMRTKGNVVGSSMPAPSTNSVYHTRTFSNVACSWTVCGGECDVL